MIMFITVVIIMLITMISIIIAIIAPQALACIGELLAASAAAR